VHGRGAIGLPRPLGGGGAIPLDFYCTSDLAALRFQDTTIQVVRSCGPWSGGVQYVCLLHL
jgi:hypothetical protein